MAIINVVKYDGGPETFAWKFPCQELGTWTQVIVNESQEAILFKGGQACDLMGPGRHTLDTANIPILNKIVNIPFGGKSPFTAEVWYVNKIHSLDIKWGTSSPIQLQDPKYKLLISVRAFGQFGIKIEDSRKFLMKLVGTLHGFNKADIQLYFKGLYLTKAKDAISQYLVKKQVSILEINAYLDELSEFLKERMGKIFSDYGIGLINFYVNDINVPESDPAVVKLRDALSKRAEMDIIGYSYVQERSFDTLEGAATNPSSGQAGLMGAGIGLGMGVGIGAPMGNQMGTLAQNINTAPMKRCPKCGRDMPVSIRFCGHCGEDTEDTSTRENKKSADMITCNKCGTEYPKTAKFCPQCGDHYNPCPFCGADLDDNAKVCAACGKTLPQPCPKCGAAITPEAKFCPECGAALIKKCANCGKEIEQSTKFCPECGTKLL